MATAPARPNLPPAFRRGATPETLRAQAWAAAARVRDPEAPLLTIADLGLLRDIKIGDGTVEVFIAPTSSGGAAMRVIALNIECALEEAGFGLARITTVSSPAWTAEAMSDTGKAKLARHGIALPRHAAEASSPHRRG